MTNTSYMPAYCDPANEFKGAKYQKGQSTKEIAALLRKDIKQGIQTGKLPKGKYSVRYKSFSGGSDINVKIKEVSFMVINPDYVKLALTPQFDIRYAPPFYTPSGVALKKAVESMLSAYNRDNSDSMTDYFDVNFYSSVDFDWSWHKGQEDELKAYFTNNPNGHIIPKQWEGVKEYEH